jgi:hypothetical protein
MVGKLNNMGAKGKPLLCNQVHYQFSAASFKKI